VTDTAVRPPSPGHDLAGVAPDDGALESVLARWLRRPFVACLVLFAIYAVCSLALNDPRGTLGTDTGGKLATLHVMDHTGSLVPEVGYWTQSDAKGDLHPLFYTFNVDGKWVNVTTLPMIYAAYPLYLVGGDRGVLLIPMLGSILCALAARALARRLGHRTGWPAFWAMGLLSPVAIYALDFWEHSLGLAFMLWGVVWLVRMLADRHHIRDAFIAGLLFGAAATMRTEALVYLVVCAGLACLVQLWRTRQLGRVFVTGVVVVSSAGIVWIANGMLERIALGGSIRGARAAGTAVGAGASGNLRAQEALTTFLGLNRFEHTADWVLGALMVACLVIGVWAFARSEPMVVLGGAAFAGAALSLLVATMAGLGFIPGMLTASPFAAVGLAFGWRRDVRFITCMATLALPLVWLFQYTGGANPQWGGRYTLLSGGLLLVAAVVVFEGRARAFVATALFAALVTASGVAWLSTRSHWVADGAEALLARHDHALISGEAHVLREAGAFYEPARHWLTAVDNAQLGRAVRTVDEGGDEEFGYVVAAGKALPPNLGAYRLGEVERIRFLPGYTLRVGTYRRS
jgi:hypothetical protein